ncbi:uncharacterized protein LOC110635253 [Hevea brasiliensis]|uniref:uncharacterized protein LOC110635253 n=1 Tax=Hevea brasiliensis TaxID=3981 RepID=UPI0025CC15E2|nr:uncharacterized protein LOC110635253 [Hevea brasiliensis]
MADVARADRLSPLDYKVDIRNFSLIKDMGKYNSAVFEAKGYKWKLVLHPNGNKSKNVTDHISLYLALADPVKLGFEVRAVFHLYLYDHLKKEFLKPPGIPKLWYVLVNILLIVAGTDAEEKKGCFHLLNRECGLDKFVDHKVFSDPSSGFLKEQEACTFGAKVVSVSEVRTTGRGESLSMIKKDLPITYKWKIEEFSTKREEECVDSPVFNAGKHRWKIQLYPRGEGLENDTHVSLYLALEDPTTPVPSSKTYAAVTLRILDQSKHKHISHKDNFWFSPSSPNHGWRTFISVGEFDRLKQRLVARDTCFVEAEIYLVAETEEF